MHLALNTARNHLVRLTTVTAAATATGALAHGSLSSIGKVTSGDPKEQGRGRAGLLGLGALAVVSGIGLFGAVRSYRATRASLTDAVSAAHQITRTAAQRGKPIEVHITSHGGLVPGYAVRPGTTFLPPRLGDWGYVARVDFDGAVHLMDGVRLKRAFPVDASPALREAHDDLLRFAIGRDQLHAETYKFGGQATVPPMARDLDARARAGGFQWSANHKGVSFKG